MLTKESLTKLEAQQGLWGKILATTPIVMTVLATVFAGLSSSEMTQAMFHRSLASQLQSKAGDQWAYFQAKRIRGTTLESAVELLQTLGSASTFNVDKLIALLDQLGSSAPKELNVSLVSEQLKKLKSLIGNDERALNQLIAGRALAEPSGSAIADQKLIDVALGNIAARKSAEDINLSFKPLSRAQIESAIKAAEQFSDQFSQMHEPATGTAFRLKQCLVALEGAMQSMLDPAPANPQVSALVQKIRRQIAGGKVALNEFDARRYRQESQHNRRVAELYELQVWRSGMESDRHRHRSQLFFYSMLVAQIGVTISSLALAQAKRSALWFISAFVGLIALGFSAWVYLSW
jgi:hypothetical protein